MHKALFVVIVLLLLIHTVALPIILMELVTEVRDQNDYNAILSCDVDYAYPPPDIIWSIMTDLSEGFIVLHENTTSSSDYELHSDGTIEVYRRFLFEEGYVIVMCSAFNLYGYAIKKFILWERTEFEKGI